MEKIAITRTDLLIGQPLGWDIYDQQNRLLLKKGMVLHSLKQILKITELGAYRHEDDKPEELQEIHDVLSPFDRIANLAFSVEGVLTAIAGLKADSDEDFNAKILNLCDELIELCEYDIDAVIGAIHIDEQYRYTVMHPLHTGILCYIVAQCLKFEVDKTVCLLAAALTSNVGMFHLQETLQTQDDSLSLEQRKDVANHPVRSAKLLKRAGIRNKLWLEIVLQHHEQVDGSGYPRQLKSGQFFEEARILGLADRYHAMISPRGYRKGLSPTQALKKLFQTRGKEIDEKLALVFIKEVGIYPPGSFVRLKNGETAMVTRRTVDSMKPEVKCLLAANGGANKKPKLRNTTESAYEIVGLCAPLQEYDKNLKVLWDYTV